MSDFWQIALAVILMGGVVGIFIVLPIVYMVTGPHFHHGDDDGPSVVPTLMTFSLTTTQLMSQGQTATESLTEMAQGHEQRMDTPEETLAKLAQKSEQDHGNDLDGLLTLRDQSHDEALEESEQLRAMLAHPVPAELPPPSTDETPA